MNKNERCIPSLILWGLWLIFLVKTIISKRDIPWGNIFIVSLVVGIVNGLLKYICQKNNTILWLMTPLPFLLFGYILYDFNNQYI